MSSNSVLHTLQEILHVEVPMSAILEAIIIIIIIVITCQILLSRILHDVDQCEQVEYLMHVKVQIKSIEGSMVNCCRCEQVKQEH